jgi:protein TonB
MAAAAHVQGTVRFEATINTDGKIQNVQLISGPPLLVQAATGAVRQWEYKPTILGGSPVNVSTIVDVDFALQP